MTRDRFHRLVAEALDSLPARFRQRIRNVAVVVEDVPPGQPDPEALLEENPDENLWMGLFDGIPATEKSVWDAAGPDRVILYQKNIEAVCETDDEIREEVRLTVLHELGHYFGMDEDQLEDV
jgi:predicted Zn-dependent protease with MMP-like domain